LLLNKEKTSCVKILIKISPPVEIKKKPPHLIYPRRATPRDGKREKKVFSLALRKIQRQKKSGGVRLGAPGLSNKKTAKGQLETKNKGCENGQGKKSRKMW